MSDDLKPRTNCRVCIAGLVLPLSPNELLFVVIIFLRECKMVAYVIFSRKRTLGWKRHEKSSLGRKT